MLGSFSTKNSSKSQQILIVPTTHSMSLCFHASSVNNSVGFHTLNLKYRTVDFYYLKKYIWYHGTREDQYKTFIILNWIFKIPQSRFEGICSCDQIQIYFYIYLFIYFVERTCRSEIYTDFTGYQSITESNSRFPFKSSTS